MNRALPSPQPARSPTMAPMLFDETPERFGCGGERGDLGGGHRLEMALQDGAVARARLLQGRLAGSRQRNEDDAAVGRVALALHPAALLEALDQQRHRRLGEPFA